MLPLTEAEPATVDVAGSGSAERARRAQDVPSRLSSALLRSHDGSRCEGSAQWSSKRLQRTDLRLTDQRTS